jgi:predicted flavoprotein YhiN
MFVRICVCAAFTAMLSGCGTGPTSPTPNVACSAAVITIGVFSNGAPASPGQGMVWTSYFGATVLPAQPSVYVVDLNFAPVECLAAWTAVSADTSAVQLSPASGSGRSQVELFMPANTGAQRSTLVTIAGQTASITQRGR